MARLVLASGSPRRKTLLRAAGFRIDAVRPPDICETRHPGEQPKRYVRRIATKKAQTVAALEANAFVLAADTIVHLGEQIFPKPVDDNDAKRILTGLSGRWHQVTTAWAISDVATNGARRRFQLGHRTTRVRFRALTPGEIDRYIATGEGRDKAGAYAVQGAGISLIQRVVGSTTNVVGLPLEAVIGALERAGVNREHS